MTGEAERCLARSIHSLGRPCFYESLAAYLHTTIDFDNIIALVFRGSDRPLLVFKDFRGPNVFMRLEKD